MQPKDLVSYEETKKLSPATVRACWLVLEEMASQGEQFGKEDIWIIPTLREHMFYRVKMKWADITGRAAHYYPYADWLIHATFIRCRKVSAADRSKQFQESVGRPFNNTKEN